VAKQKMVAAAAPIPLIIMEGSIPNRRRPVYPTER
jgi:hypothetical protein